MKRVIKVKLWVIILTAIICIAVFGLQNSILKYESPYFIAEKFSGLSVPKTSEIYYYINSQNVIPSDAVTIIVLKIPDKYVNDISVQCQEEGFSVLTDSTELNGFGPNNNIVVIRKGYYKTRGCSKDTYWDTENGILYIMDVDF